MLTGGGKGGRQGWGTIDCCSESDDTGVRVSFLLNLMLMGCLYAGSSHPQLTIRPELATQKLCEPGMQDPTVAKEVTATYPNAKAFHTAVHSSIVPVPEQVALWVLRKVVPKGSLMGLAQYDLSAECTTDQVASEVGHPSNSATKGSVPISAITRPNDSSCHPGSSSYCYHVRSSSSLWGSAVYRVPVFVRSSIVLRVCTRRLFQRPYAGPGGTCRVARSCAVLRITLGVPWAGTDP